MTVRPYELLARFAANGSVAGVSVRTITTVNGRDYESDPQPLSGASDAVFKAFADQFSAAAVTERDSLQQQVTSLTAVRDALQTQVDTIPGLQSQVETLAASKADLEAEVARLTALVPPPIGPRQIYPRELLARLTVAEVVAAIRTDDDDAIYAVANLQTTISPVNLDSEEVRQLMGALVLAGILTPERLAEVLA